MLPSDTLAASFCALSHKRRVLLFRLLADAPEKGLSFSDLQARTRFCDGVLSHHLRQMVRYGLVLRRPAGAEVMLSLTPDALTLALADTHATCRNRGSAPGRRAA